MSTFLTYILFIHVFLSIISEFIFLCAFLTALSFILKYRQLKEKFVVTDSKGTSLSSLEFWIARLSICGLVFITLTLLTGAVLLIVRGLPQQGLIKIIWAFFVWSWYVFTLFGRNYWGWKGRKGAWLIIGGLVLLCLDIFIDFSKYL